MNRNLYIHPLTAGIRVALYGSPFTGHPEV